MIMTVVIYDLIMQDKLSVEGRAQPLESGVVFSVLMSTITMDRIESLL